MKNFKILAILTLLTHLMFSCAAGPNYKKPKVCLSKKYDNQHEAKSNPADLKCWWKKFNDPILDNLICVAIENNFDLSIALERIEETRALYNIEKAKLFPEVSASAKTIRARISQDIFSAPFIGPAVQNFYIIGFDALWEIDIFGGLRRSKEAAFYEFQSQQEDMRDVLITLLSDVARNYMQYISINKLIDCDTKIVENQKRILNITENINQIGLANLIEVENERAELARREKELIELKKTSKVSFNRLAILLGYQPEKFSLTINKNYEFQKIDKMVSSGIPSELLRRRPDIRRAERNLARSSAEIGVAVADLFPKFSLTGNFSFLSNQASRWFEWSSRTWLIGPTFDWNLFAFGKYKAKIRAKKHKYKQMLLEYEKTIIIALEDVENALVAFFYQNDNLQKSLLEFNATKRTLELNCKLLDSGLKDQQDYLKSENSFLEVKKTYITSQKDLVNNLISLYKSLGGGWESI